MMGYRKKGLCAGCLGLAFGIVNGLVLMIIAIAAWRYNYGNAWVGQMGPMYYGYEPTLMGALYGFLWGLISGFIFGLLLGWIYNLCAGCCKCKRCYTTADGATVCEKCGSRVDVDRRDIR